MRTGSLLISVLFYICLSAAWPWPANLFVRDSTGLVRRQNDPPPSSSAAPASSASQNTASNTGSATGSSAPSGTNSGSTAPSSKPTDKPDDNKSKGDDNTSKGDDKKNSTSISIDPQSPAGGISMVLPAATTTTYYKYGSNVTWIWNYTSLIVTPSAVDVLVSCSDTASTFTVAQNVSVNATQSIVWDTSKETGAGITDKYTLAIYDAGNPAGISATAEPGKLGVFDQFVFGMYTPQPYTAIGDGYRCVTCNGAMSSAERQALGLMMTVATITVLSFGYFANGFMNL